MARKHRRKIKRRKRSKKIKRHRTWLWKQFNGQVTNRFTRVTTWIMLITEILFLFVCATWAFVEVTARLFGWFGGY